MTDTPKPSQEASAAWQDVKRYEQSIAGQRWKCYAAKDVERARAADAQQIAVWRKIFEVSEATLAEACQQIAALRAEIEQLKKKGIVNEH